MKSFLVILVILSSAYAGLVNAIAFKVNNNIVTLYDIDNAMSSKKLTKAQAIEYLTIEILKKSAIKEFAIDVNESEVDAQIRQISARNGMNLEQFKSMLSSRFIDYNNYYDGLKKQLVEQKLFAKISQSNVKKPSEEELVVYYNTHKDIFASGGTIDVIKYSSQDQQSIIKAAQSPLMVMDNVTKQEQSLELSAQIPQIIDAINKTSEGSFTRLIQESGFFISYFIKSKQNTKVADFKNIKENVLTTMMQDRQRSSAMLYFQKLRSQSNIKFIR